MYLFSSVLLFPVTLFVTQRWQCFSPSPVSDSDSIWVVAGRFRDKKYLSEKILFGFIFILTVKSDLSNPRAPGGIVSFGK